jgi:hypothetical protein
MLAIQFLLVPPQPTFVTVLFLNFFGTLCIEIVRTSIVDATQDHCRTSPDRNTTRVPPGTRHKSEHVDTPSTVGHGLAAPAPTARNTATATSRHIAFRRPLVALAHALSPCSPSPRRSYTAPALVDAGHSPSLVRFSSLDTLDAGLLARSPNDARATKKHKNLRHGVLQHGGQQKTKPLSKRRTKRDPKSETHERTRSELRVRGRRPQYAAHAANSSSNPRRPNDGQLAKWDTGKPTADLASQQVGHQHPQLTKFPPDGNLALRTCLAGILRARTCHSGHPSTFRSRSTKKF